MLFKGLLDGTETDERRGASHFGANRRSFPLLAGKNAADPSLAGNVGWSGSENPEWQTAEMVAGWERIEEFLACRCLPIPRGKDRHLAEPYVIEVSFLIMSCSFFFSFKCTRMCLETGICSEGYGVWETKADGEKREGWPRPDWVPGNSAGHTYQNYFKIHNIFFKSLKS